MSLLKYFSKKRKTPEDEDNQDMDQLTILSKLASQHDKWYQIYPSLSKLAAIAFTVPISSVNCERDFSTMNRVKTDLRNRLQGDHLAACMLLSINGPPLSEFPYNRALGVIFPKAKTYRQYWKCSHDDDDHDYLFLAFF
ncbi:hypothetical protein AALO_G00124530 [Alosa alosa]|uniref:HAT C-terminal dimerisation domain-containing protein n=1 Tax=Alosa alosa TaxID=278164 RepID=A0AAV6GLT0_9TELE|nr:hypothetical protein AALO_G00124530 [Alosa alosa]